MNAKNTGSITPADVAEQAVAEGLVIPGQNTEVKVPVEVVEEKIVKVSVEDGKKTLGMHVDAAVSKIKQNKRVVLVAGATVATGILAYVRFAAKKAAEQMSDEDKDALDQARADAESIADLG